MHVEASCDALASALFGSPPGGKTGMVALKTFLLAAPNILARFSAGVRGAAETVVEALSTAANTFLKRTEQGYIRRMIAQHCTTRK